MKRFSIALVALAAALAIAPAASADTFYVDFGGPGISGSAVISATALSSGVFGITNITGMFADTNTGVSGTIADPFSASLSTETSPDGLWYYDNLLYMIPGQQFIDSAAGWLFDVGSDEVNLFGGGSGAYPYYEMVSINSNGYANWYAPADVLVSTTPEPSSLILLGSGLLGLAFLAFRKSRTSRRARPSLPA